MTDDGYELIVARPAASRAIADTLPEPVAAAVIDFITGSLIENPRLVGRGFKTNLPASTAPAEGATESCTE